MTICTELQLTKSCWPYVKQSQVKAAKDYSHNTLYTITQNHHISTTNVRRNGEQFVPAIL